MLAESRRLRMFNRGLVFCSMRLGVPFIAPRQLGAVGSPFGRQFLPSVRWRTGQSSAPPDMNSARFISFFGEADRWTLGPLGTPNTVRCGLVTVGFGHALNALPTVGVSVVGSSDSLVHTGQSGEFYPQCPPWFERAECSSLSQLMHRTLSDAPAAGAPLVVSAELLLLPLDLT
jgi:hypothetical protein